MSSQDEQILGGSYTWGEHGEVKSLCGALGTNVTLCVEVAQIKEKNQQILCIEISELSI